MRHADLHSRLAETRTISDEQRQQTRPGRNPRREFLKSTAAIAVSGMYEGVTPGFIRFYAVRSCAAGDR
jgi:hypothetical protein